MFSTKLLFENNKNKVIKKTNAYTFCRVDCENASALTSPL